MFSVTKHQKSSVQNKIMTARKLIRKFGKLVDLAADGIFDQVAFSVVDDGLIACRCANRIQDWFDTCTMRVNAKWDIPECGRTKWSKLFHNILPFFARACQKQSIERGQSAKNLLPNVLKKQHFFVEDFCLGKCPTQFFFLCARRCHFRRTNGVACLCESGLSACSVFIWCGCGRYIVEK